MPKKLKNPKVLVLGATGMLGSMVVGYLKQNAQLEVMGSSRKGQNGSFKFDVEEFVAQPNLYQSLASFDYVINCIGIIKPHCHDDNPAEVYQAIQVNALFPHKLSRFLLDQHSSAKIIQIATDCVYSGKIGNYIETAIHDPADVYGKTKSLGEVRAENLLNIRCSIIGPEVNSKLSLLEWFLNQPAEAILTGYANHYWNGVTTLQFAQLCEVLIQNDLVASLIKTSYLHHFVPNQKVSKYRLLQIFQKVFQTNHVIKKVPAPGGKVDRSLASSFANLEQVFSHQTMLSAIKELKKYTS